MPQASPPPSGCAPPARATAICRCAGGPTETLECRVSYSENRFPLFPDMRCLPRLLGVRLELLFQRRELGKRRIRIGFLVATVPAVAAPLDVLRAQRRIAIRTIAARRPVGAVATVLAALLVIAALWATRPLRTLGAPLVGTIRALMTLRALAAIGARLMAAGALGRRRSRRRPPRRRR